MRAAHRAALGALSALAAMLACKPPETSSNHGGVACINDIAEYLEFAAGAVAAGYERFGNSAVGVCLPHGNLTAPFVDPSAEEALDQCVGLVDGSRARAIALSEFYVGKFSIYADRSCDPRDRGGWEPQSWRRLGAHARDEAPWRLSVIVGVFSSQDAAYDAEKHIQFRLGELTGVVSQNGFPYKKGRKSEKGSAFAVYLLAR